jgi:flagellin
LEDLRNFIFSQTSCELVPLLLVVLKGFFVAYTVWIHQSHCCPKLMPFMNITLSSALSTQSSNAAMDLARSQRANDDSSARLASGTKLVHTSTDPGGYAVSLKLRHTSSVLGALELNMLNARSFLDMQGAGLASTSTVLQRIDEIVTLMKDPTKSDEDKANYISEVDQLRKELLKVQRSTLNGKTLFTAMDQAQGDTLAVQLDEGGRSVTLTRPDFSIDTRWNRLIGDPPDYTGWGTTSAEDLIVFANSGDLNALIQDLATMMATNGAEQSRLDFAIDNLRTKATAFTEARSRISDVDVATEVTRLNRSSVLLQSGASMLTQANVSNELALKLLSA